MQESSEKYRGLLKVFDRPLWKDWVFWLFAASVAAATANNRSALGGDSTVEPVSGLIDLSFNLAINYLIWAVVPSTIRGRIRKKRTTETIESREWNSNSERSIEKVDPTPDTYASPDEPNRPDSHDIQKALKKKQLPQILGGLLLVLIVATLQANLEYRTLITDIENAEAVLENYLGDIKLLSTRLEELKAQGEWNTSNAEAIQLLSKVETQSSIRATELGREIQELNSRFQAPWNRATQMTRHLARDHFNSWKTFLDRRSLAFATPDTETTDVISSTFIELCDYAKRKRSLLAWPSAHSDSFTNRITDV